MAKLALILFSVGVVLGQPSSFLGVLVGTPPGGVGAACNSAAIAYLRPTGSGNNILTICYMNVWTDVSTGGGGMGTPGGASNSVQYNAGGGNFGGVTNLTTDGTNPLLTAIAAPSSPASGFGAVYEDSTSLNLAFKNAAGTVNHGVQTRSASASNWIRSIDDAGVAAISQPASTDLSDASNVALINASNTFSGTNNTFTGNVVLTTNRHLNMSGASGDSSGTVATSASTTGSTNFTTAYASAPRCTLTATSDPGAGTRVWVTSSTTAVTVNTNTSSTVTFNFWCVGAPN